MLKYCAWCGKYQGATDGRGHQIRENVCEIDTATICPDCLAGILGADKPVTSPSIRGGLTPLPPT